MREIAFHKRRRVRYCELTSHPKKLAAATTRFVITNLEGELRHTIGNFYGLRKGIEYGYKHSKNKLGWASYGLTN